jgi:uncharacterized protein YlxP (DUF503 family)
MFVCVSRIELHLPNGASLKGKRQILKSLKDRIQHRYNVSIAEVEDQDLWQKAVLGVACVGNEQFHVRQMVEQVIRMIQSTPAVEVLHCDTEVM